MIQTQGSLSKPMLLLEPENHYIYPQGHQDLGRANDFLFVFWVLFEGSELLIIVGTKQRESQYPPLRAGEGLVSPGR